MRRDRSATVGGVLLAKLGFRRATLVGAYISLWSLYRATEGSDPVNLAELANAIQRDTSTVYRWQADFTECFPQWSDPGALLDAHGLRDALNARQAMQIAWSP